MSRAFPEGRDGLVTAWLVWPVVGGWTETLLGFRVGVESTVAMIRKQTGKKSAIEVA